MSEDYLPTLFDSFSREYNTTIGKVSGTGFGLSSVIKLVDMMDGEICVKSKMGEGAGFKKKQKKKKKKKKNGGN